MLMSCIFNVLQYVFQNFCPLQICWIKFVFFVQTCNAHLVCLVKYFCVAVSHTTHDLVFIWNMTDPLVVNPEVELPQLDISNNYTEDCTIEYSTGKTNFYWPLLFSPSFHTHNTRDPWRRPTVSSVYPVLGGAIGLACDHDVWKNSFPRRVVELSRPLIIHHATNTLTSDKNFNQIFFFLKSSEKQHEFSLRKKLFKEKLIECSFEDLIYILYIKLKLGVINFLVSGSHLPGWDWCKLSQVFVESFYR